MQLTLATANYDRIMALALGDVKPEGITLDVKRLATPEIFARADRYEFDISEFSISKYVEQRQKGDDRYQAIPVFLSRFFRHWSMYVREGVGIETPKDLRGKTAGVPNYRYTSSVWTRGILKDDYGIEPSDMKWVQIEDIPPPDDDRVSLETRPGGDLNRMLLDGEIDFLVSPYPPAAIFQPDPPVRRLLKNAGQLERDFYRFTGIFPQMHTVVVKREIIDSAPEVARSLYDAFNGSKKWALTHLKGLRISLPWLYEQVEETAALMGEDHWPYGLEANRAGIELIVRYMVDQNIISGSIRPEDLFPAFD